MSDSEYEEEFLVFADFQNQIFPQQLANENSALKIIGIETKNPVAEINGSIFKGTYDFAMGTDVFFDKDNDAAPADPLYEEQYRQKFKIIGKTNKVINFQRLYVENISEKKENELSEGEISNDATSTSEDSLRLNITYDEVINQFPNINDCVLTERDMKVVITMDAILGQIARPPINLKEFLLSYQNTFKHPYTIPTFDINIQDNMHLSNENERYNRVKENCAIDHLKHPNDGRVTTFIPGCSSIARKGNTNVDINALKLKTFHSLAKHKTSKKPTAFQRTRDSFSMTKHPSVDTEATETLLPFEDIIIYVRFYRPTRATHIGRTIERPVFSQEIACLGRNFLSELRDKVYCVCNNKRFFDVSENPDAPLSTKETDPGFFFITDTFYNDKRNPLNMDYSKVIRHWAKKAKGLNNLQFKIGTLEKTRFIDLTINLGFPQLYQHHGNCEHVFVFSNVEIITNPSNQLIPSLSCYPFILSVSTNNTRACNICGRLNYVFVVEGSNRQLEDPAFLCKQCFLSFHYVDGKKIGEFSAYRLIDETKSSLQDICGGGDDAIDDTTNDVDVVNEINDDSGHFEVFDIIIKEETTCNLDD